jgi:hypothetical protein
MPTFASATRHALARGASTGSMNQELDVRAYRWGLARPFSSVGRTRGGLEKPSPGNFRPQSGF